MIKFSKIKIAFLILTFFCLPTFVSAVYPGEKQVFFVENSYDSSEREQISATVQKIGENIYFFIDDDYWNSLKDQEKETIEESLENLDNEFNNKIYPT